MPQAEPEPQPLPVLTQPGTKLFLVSFLVLFVELLLIRWIPSTLHIVAFFNNLVLIGCFLGLGVGMLRPTGLAAGVWQVLFRLSLTTALLAFLGSNLVNVTLPEGGDYGLNEVSVDVGFNVPLPAVLLGVFALVVWVMFPLGQLMALCFDPLPKLRAYSINIGGSLVGVLGFAVLAWLGLPPWAWYLVALLVLAVLHLHVSHLIPAGLIAVSLVGQAYNSTHGFLDEMHWSPYYKILVRQMVQDDPAAGFTMDVNNQFLLSGFDLRPDAKLDVEAVAQSQTPNLAALSPEARAEALKTAAKIVDDVAMLKSYYEFPFRLRPARRVLILGSGAGNDVATALRMGVEQVTAVEIDPRVLELGRRHPERPYDSPKVTIICNDARAYLNRTSDQFDLIIFATLDAHGLISSVGNVRLDSFIYTKQSLEAAKRLLTPDGLMVLSFGPFREWTQFRQFATLRSVFGHEPRFFHHGNDHRTFVAGNLAQVQLRELPPHWRGLPPAEIERKMREYPFAALPATDDWPHLYIKEPRIPVEYYGVLGGVVLLALILVGWQMRATPRFEPDFFFLGSGFLLMETKSVTEFALLFGSTWQVNVAVFSIILVVILLANGVVHLWGRLPIPAAYAALAASLVAGYLYPPTVWAQGLGPTALVLGAGLYLGVPIFLAALIFASSLRLAAVGSVALGCNILGSVLGGTCEYLSMAFGLRFLSLLALGMYVAALAGYWWMRPRRATRP
ncbi:MAG TPA: methyltransferase domain-containing protein [Gemmatales bacterium]|nr:methyltransferase domain-containing protein [Gemmatales bacterium]